MRYTKPKLVKPAAPAVPPAASAAPANQLAHQLDWDDLRFFLAVVAAGSLSAAARALKVNTTTVLRRIASLEAALDARLFARGRSGYTLTQDGARLLASLEPIDTQLSSLARDFQAARDTKSVVRLGSGEVLAQGVIAPALGALHTAAPDVVLDVVTDSSLLGPARAPRILTPLRDVDLALRLARPMSGDMLMRKLGDVQYGLYATPKLAARYAGSLAGCPVIGFGEKDEPLGPIWWLERHAKGADMVLRASHAGVRLEAALAGRGYAVLPCILADAQKGLRRCLLNGEPGQLEIWLLARTDMARLPHVRAVMDFLIAQTRACATQLQGGQIVPVS